MDGVEIRESRERDIAAIEALYPQAFPDEDLLPLAGDLLERPAIAMLLIAIVDSQVEGHVIFTSCGVAGNGTQSALLGPLAVAPDKQRQGIGSRLVEAGLARLKDKGVVLVCVLGDPGYYVRLGFRPECHIEPPYELPSEWQGAWQSQYLRDLKVPPAGTLAVPAPWQDSALWAP